MEGVWDASALPFSGGHGGGGRAMNARLHAAAVRSPAGAPRRPSPRNAGGLPVAEEARLPCSCWKGPVAER